MFDTERFLCEIEDQPPLYDVKSKEYSNREMKANCWLKIAKAMFDTWEEFDSKTKDEKVRDLMKKWKGIRDCFVREHRTITATGTGQAATEKKRYVYYDQLQFLVPHVKGSVQTSSNIEPSTAELENVEESEIEDMPNLTSLDEEVTEGNNSSSNEPATIIQSKKRKRSNDGLSSSKRAPSTEKSLLSSTKDLTNILASSLELQKEQNKPDKFGHKAFLLSFVPVLESLPFNASMQLRSQISQIFSNYYSQSDNPSGSASRSSSGPPATPLGYESDISEEFNISTYLQF